MQPASQYTSQYRNEAAVIHRFMPEFYAISQSQWKVGHATSQTSRAWRISQEPRIDAADLAAVILTDFDDTLHPHTDRKKLLYSTYQKLFSDFQEAEHFSASCASLNEACRVLPVNGVHPEHYSPFLELIASTTLLHNMEEKTVEGNAIKLLQRPSEEAARSYVAWIARNFMQQQLQVIEGSKIYFREKKNSALTTGFSTCPENVDIRIWQLYTLAMTHSTVPAGELTHYDLSDNVYWTITTFGDLAYQLTKVTSFLKDLKNQNERLPNEVVLFSRGRKPPILEQLTRSFQAIPIVYVDDSPRQLENVPAGIVPVQAVRNGAKRAVEEAEKNRPLIAYMEHESLSQILYNATGALF